MTIYLRFLIIFSLLCLVLIPSVTAQDSQTETPTLDLSDADSIDPFDENAADLRVFIAHGTADRMVEYESGLAAFETLSDYGYDATFFEFDGGHTVPSEALLEVEAWLRE